MVWEIITPIVVIGGIGALVYMSIRIVRPTERGLVERFGKYHHFVGDGLHFLVPFIDKLVRINITEQMVDAEPQEVITKDNLNAKVDAQVYFKVRTDEESVKASEYHVDNYYTQIVALARTTLRDIVGKLPFKDVNSKREVLNQMLAKELDEQTNSWGIQVVRTELKEIEPPEDVQATMNKVLKAENEKIAANDFATAVETKADGERRAAIKVAEGRAKAVRLQADAEREAIELAATGRSRAIKLVHEAAQTYFKDQAVELKKLETAEKMFKKNSKIIVSEDKPILKAVAEIMSLKDKE